MTSYGTGVDISWTKHCALEELEEAMEHCIAVQHWIDDDQNLFIIGKCGTGKTSLASHLGRKALAADIKVCYNTVESFLYTLETKDHMPPGVMKRVWIPW